MSGPADEWDRRRRDTERWDRLERRLERFDERLAAIEKTATDQADRKRHVAEWWRELGDWLVWTAKLIGAFGVIGASFAAFIIWIVRHGG